MSNSHLKPLFNACYQVQFQKNLIIRFCEKFKSVDFGPQNDPFPLILSIIRNFPKNPNWSHLPNFQCQSSDTISERSSRDFEKTSKMSILVPKTAHPAIYPILDAIRIFHKNPKQSLKTIFWCLPSGIFSEKCYVQI